MKFPLSLRRKVLIGLLTILLAGLVLTGLRAYLHSPGRGLPYRDSFAEGKADEWKAFGGTWELVNGMIIALF